MTQVNLSKQHPTAYKQVSALSKEADAALVQAGLDPKLGELVKLRVSQINGCAFCLRMHTRDALAMGETTDRLAVVAAWWESHFYQLAYRDRGIADAIFACTPVSEDAEVFMGFQRFGEHGARFVFDVARHRNWPVAAAGLEYSSQPADDQFASMGDHLPRVAA